MNRRGVRPAGAITRGTTHPNRLRRVDAWTVRRARRALLAAEQPPVVVDLGFGASPITTVEFADRLQKVRPDVAMVGIEIDPERVALAQQWARPGVEFVHGGFDFDLHEVGCHAQSGVTVLRAFNVLRQYDESDVAPNWRLLAARLSPDGVAVEGTCDEIGRRAAWVDFGVDAVPRSLTFATRLGGLSRPSELAERLPKVLIHRNVPGEPVYELLDTWDRAWERSAARGVFGVRQRWIEAATQVRDAGWPVLDGPSRWRLGELSLAWTAIAPR